jgi:hypothetical protein
VRSKSKYRHARIFGPTEGAVKVNAVRAETNQWADNAGVGYHIKRFSGTFRFAIDVAADSVDIVSVDLDANRSRGSSRALEADARAVSIISTAMICMRRSSGCGKIEFSEDRVVARAKEAE